MIQLSQPHSFKVGDQLEIIPNHICSTINLHESVYMQAGKQRTKLAVAARGKIQ